MLFNKKYFVLIILSVIVFSCTVKKRVHRDGYYISWNKHRTWKTENEKKQERSVLETITRIDIPLEASNDKSFILHSNEKELPDSNACGDTLLLRSGTKYIVKVLEITDIDIKVRRCADKSGNILTFNLVDVERVTDVTGVVLITPPTKKEIKESAKEMARYVTTGTFFSSA